MRGRLSFGAGTGLPALDTTQMQANRGRVRARATAV